MRSRNREIFRLATCLFKAKNIGLPTPYTSHFKPANCQGTSTLAILDISSNSHVTNERYLPTLNINTFRNRIADVKYNFEAFNIGEAQELIAKIVFELESIKAAYSIALNPIILDAYYYKGVCFSKGGLQDKEDAIQAFKKALEINPNHELSKTGLRNVELAFGIDEKGYPIAKKF
jgi:tetratricopeptide (TPR) repeat protein